jgi:hypothetical protein
MDNRNCSTCNAVFSTSYQGKNPVCSSCRKRDAVATAQVLRVVDPLPKPKAETWQNAESLTKKERFDYQVWCTKQFVQAASSVPGFSISNGTHIAFLRNKYPFPPNSEVPHAIPQHLHQEWIYLGERSYGSSFRDVVRLLIFARLVEHIGKSDILDGRGFFDNDLAVLRNALGFN